MSYVYAVAFRYCKSCGKEQPPICSKAVPLIFYPEPALVINLLWFVKEKKTTTIPPSFWYQSRAAVIAMVVVAAVKGKIRILVKLLLLFCHLRPYLGGMKLLKRVVTGAWNGGIDQPKSSTHFVIFSDFFYRSTYYLVTHHGKKYRVRKEMT